MSQNPLGVSDEVQKREDDAFKGDVNQPSPELLRQIAGTLQGNDQTPAVKRWVKAHEAQFGSQKE